MNTTAEQFAQMLEEAAALNAPQPMVLEPGQIVQGIVMQDDLIYGHNGAEDSIYYTVILDEEDWTIKLLDLSERLHAKIDFAGIGGPDEGDRISVLRRWDGSYEVLLNWNE